MKYVGLADFKIKKINHVQHALTWSAEVIKVIQFSVSVQARYKVGQVVLGFAE